MRFEAFNCGSPTSCARWSLTDTSKQSYGWTTCQRLRLFRAFLRPCLRWHLWNTRDQRQACCRFPPLFDCGRRTGFRCDYSYSFVEQASETRLRSMPFLQTGSSVVDDSSSLIPRGTTRTCFRQKSMYWYKYQYIDTDISENTYNSYRKNVNRPKIRWKGRSHYVLVCYYFQSSMV